MTDSSDQTGTPFPKGPATSTSPDTAQTPKATTPELAPEDFYIDGPYLVFTAVYHRKRGFCCNSGCRHCPFR